jgi:hypothetical protein
LRLLADFANRGREDGLAEFLDAARKAPFADARRPGALNQKHAPVPPNDAENADDGPLWVVPGHGASDSLSLRERVGVRGFQGHRPMSQSLI